MNIVVKGLYKRFDKEYVLNNIDISFEGGNIYGLVGKNGSGKSVFLKCLCGIYSKSKGTILYDFKEYNRFNQVVPGLRACLDKASFFPDLSGYDNLKLLAKIQNRISDDDIFNALKVVNLYYEKDKKFSSYSLGMRQKLGIAQVIMESPDILIFDESFNGIDSESLSVIYDYLIQEKLKGKIIIISSHINNDIDALCDFIYSFEDGKVKCIK